MPNSCYSFSWIKLDFILLNKLINQGGKYKLIKGEICVENFIPPADGASLGSYFCEFSNK